MILRLIAIIISIFIVVFIVYISLKDGKSNNNKSENASTESTYKNSDNVSENEYQESVIQSIKRKISSSPNDVELDKLLPPEILNSRAGKMLQMAKGSMSALVLHGRLEDQYGNPVAGAEVSADYTGTGFYQGDGDLFTVTNNTGYFKLSGEGQAMQIVGVNHPALSRFRADIGIAGTTNTRTYLNLDGDYFADSKRKGQSAQDPYIVEVWRVDDYEEVEFYGEYHDVSILLGPENGSKSKYSLEFECERQKWENNNGKSGTWQAKLSVVGEGGFQVASDTYLNVAPVSGYDIEYIDVGYEYGKDSYRSDHRFKGIDQYYFSANGGRVYGVIKLRSVNPYIAYKCGIDFVFIKLNKNGSRSLAVRADLENR